MKYTINLFGYNLECGLVVNDNELSIKIPQKEQDALNAYLRRVLVRYSEFNEENNCTINDLIDQALQIEKRLGGKLNEPKIKLPYEFQPEIKDKLIEMASAREISATKLLIDLIETKYQALIN